MIGVVPLCIDRRVLDATLISRLDFMQTTAALGNLQGLHVESNEV